MSRGQVRKGYLRRQKDRQLEREKGAKRKQKKREVVTMGKATEGYKAARLSHLQELQNELAAKTEDLRVAEFSLERYKKAWHAEKEVSLSLTTWKDSLTEQVASLQKYVRRLRIAIGALAGALILTAVAWVAF